MAANPEFTRFLDRRDAGRRLAARLAGEPFGDAVVVGMARGGVPVAAEVARALGLPLDIAVVRKVGAPNQPELAIGAIAEDAAAVVDERDARQLGLDEDAVRAVVTRERQELERRVGLYRAECPRLDLTGRTAILVDDGLATGHTAMAAARSLRARGARRIVLAVPVCPAERAAEAPEPPVDRLIWVTAPHNMLAVGYWYADFPQVSDDELIALLRAARGGGAAPAEADEAGDGDRPGDAGEIAVTIHADGALLPGTLNVPAGARGVVLFAHGSGSGRLSPRNRMVAERLAESDLATLLFDLLDEHESRDRAKVFDIALLADRLVAAVAWLRQRPEARELPVGLFGASTGGGAALAAAADSRIDVRAVVSRGGRPDLAGDALPRVLAPTLLIVGGADHEVMRLNEGAMRRMTCPVELSVVAGAGHLFEGRGELERVADLAADWFNRHLAGGADEAT